MLDSVLGLTSTRAIAIREVKSLSVVRPSRGYAVIHPRYRTWLAKQNLATAEDFLALRGDILSGHHDRHVVRVELKTRIVYLKREHRVSGRIRRRNRRAGFGMVSRSVREAKVLERLSALSRPGPQWIAYGEDGRGRAFLLVDDLAGCEELRLTAAGEQDPLRRREIAEEIGVAIAGLHVAKIDTPDLAAKHIFLRRDTADVTVIDWPSARFGPVSHASRVDALAQLDASLTDALASPRERLRMLRAYLRNLKGMPPFKVWARQIQKASEPLKLRGSIRDQHCDPAIAASQRLVWLAPAEAVCVTPALAEVWPQPAITIPYYPLSGEPIRAGDKQHVLAPDGKTAILLRWRTTAPLSRLKSWLRDRCWRSPGALFAKQIFRRQRLGQPTPTLLAFGQRLTSPITAESFALIRTGDETPC